MRWLLVLFAIITSAVTSAHADEPTSESASTTEMDVALLESLEQEVATLQAALDELKTKIAELKGEQPEPKRFYGFFGSHMHLDGAVDPEAVWDVIVVHSSLMECRGVGLDKGSAMFIVGPNGRVSGWSQETNGVSRCVADVILGLQFPLPADGGIYSFRLIDF